MSKTETKPSQSNAARTTSTAPQSSTGSKPTAAGSPARSWQEIQVGSVVVAHESMEDGWWEAVVTAIAGDALTLRWRDYPKQPPATRHRAQIAFMAAEK